MSSYNDERWTFENFCQCFTESLAPQAIFPNSETGTAIIILVTDPFDLMLLEGPRKSGSRSVLIWHVDSQCKMNADLKALLVLKSNTEGHTFLGGLSLHLNHLIESRMTNYDWPFRTLPFGLFGSNLDTRDLETYPRTYSGHFWNMSIFGDSRAVWVLFRKWVVSENQSFLDEGAIVTPLSV